MCERYYRAALSDNKTLGSGQKYWRQENHQTKRPACGCDGSAPLHSTQQPYPRQSLLYFYLIWKSCCFFYHGARRRPRLCSCFDWCECGNFFFSWPCTNAASGAFAAPSCLLQLPGALPRETGSVLLGFFPSSIFLLMDHKIREATVWIHRYGCKAWSRLPCTAQALAR